MRRIVPIFIGTRDEASDVIGNLFDEDIFSLLPDVIPTKSLELASVLLRQNGIEPSPDFASLTIAKVVLKLKGYLGVFAWEKNPEYLTSAITERIVYCHRKAMSEENSGSLLSNLLFLCFVVSCSAWLLGFLSFK